MSGKVQPKVCYCGSDAVARPDGNGRYWFVKCTGCDRASIHCRTFDEAVAAWNEDPSQ